MKFKLLFALLVVQLGFAQQRTCGMQEQMQRIMADPQLKQHYLDLQQQFKSEMQRLQNSQEGRLDGQSVNSTNALIRIPVAVHYPSVTADNSNTTNVNLRACLVLLAQRQINILNADYNATNSDISNWTAASAFFPGVNTGNMNVSWELATLNHPAGTGQGFPANGSPAVTFGTDFLTGADSDATWSGYCNLVVRPLGGGTLGYSPLGGSPAAGMTVVIDNNAFGAAMTTTPSTCTGYVPQTGYNLGRTLTHELGHFFNLDHTFAGCDGATCANSGDLVCDTPEANDPEYNCIPAGNRASGCGGIQLTMNYMDYPPDACMYMFTAGQTTRMIAWYNTIQTQIRTNVLANTDFITSNFSIAPNPSKGSFNIQFKDLTDGYAVEIYDVTGKVVFEDNFNASSDLIQTVSLENASKGVYFITLKSNGSVVTKKIIIE